MVTASSVKMMKSPKWLGRAVKRRLGSLLRLLTMSYAAGPPSTGSTLKRDTPEGVAAVVTEAEEVEAVLDGVVEVCCLSFFFFLLTSVQSESESEGGLFIGEEVGGRGGAIAQALSLPCQKDTPMKQEQ